MGWICYQYTSKMTQTQWERDKETRETGNNSDKWNNFASFAGPVQLHTAAASCNRMNRKIQAQAECVCEKVRERERETCWMKEFSLRIQAHAQSDLKDSLSFSLLSMLHTSAQSQGPSSILGYGCKSIHLSIYMQCHFACLCAQCGCCCFFFPVKSQRHHEQPSHGDKETSKGEESERERCPSRATGHMNCILLSIGLLQTSFRASWIDIRFSLLIKYTMVSSCTLASSDERKKHACHRSNETLYMRESKTF